MSVALSFIARVLHALQEKLLRKDLFEDFCQEFTREMNRLRMAARAGLAAAEHDLERVQHQTAKLVQALKDGVPASAVKAELIALEGRKTELQSRLARASEPPPLLHPNMADLYRRKVTELAEALGDEESRAGATESLRGLIDAITLTPHGNSLRIELQGNLAAMLKAADETSSPNDDELVQIMVVAGAGFEPPTFGL